MVPVQHRGTACAVCAPGRGGTADRLVVGAVGVGRVLGDGRGVMDVGAALAEVSKRFGVVCWRGSHTRTFWALVRCSHGWRLVEAVSIRELAMALTRPDGWPWP